MSMNGQAFYSLAQEKDLRFLLKQIGILAFILQLVAWLLTLLVQMK